MQDFKKAIVSTTIVLLLLVTISGIFLKITSPYTHNYDWYLREELKGSLDFLVVGASQGQCALYTREIDDLTNSNSYNLSYDSLRNYEKHYLLEKELNRNDIKTVVLELSYDTFQLTDKTLYTNANVFSIMRMDSFNDRLKYFINNISFDNKLYVYADLMYQGALGLIKPEPFVSETQAKLKGSKFTASKNYTLTNEEVLSEYNKNTFSITSFNEKTIQGFTELIDLCQEHNARVIVAVVPVSDNYLWQTDNLDEFNHWTKNYCQEHNVEYYDFNLLKDRYTLFSDSNCYSTDIHHMSEIGSKIFTEVFCNIINLDKDDVTSKFYDSFQQMKQDSSYMQILVNEKAVK